MKITMSHNGTEFFVFQNAEKEYVAMVCGVPTAGSATIHGAEQQGIDAIDSGVPTAFHTEITWPDGTKTSKLVNVGTDTGCVRFQEFMWRTLAKGGAFTIHPEVSW